MMKLFLYKFTDFSIASDVVDTKGKVVRYKEVFCIAENSTKARCRSKLDWNYSLTNIYTLGTDWIK